MYCTRSWGCLKWKSTIKMKSLLLWICYKDVCKTDMKALDINTESWEDLAADRMMWRSTLNQHLKTGEEKLVNAEAGKRARRKETNNSTDQRPHTNATFVAEIVSPTSVSTATSDATTMEQTGQPGCTPMIKLHRRRPYIYIGRYDLRSSHSSKSLYHSLNHFFTNNLFFSSFFFFLFFASVTWMWCSSFKSYTN